MLPGYVLSNFIIFALINAFTPGPGNILALNTVTNYGWRRGRLLFLGIFTGYYLVQLICGLFVFGLSTLLPQVLTVMKYVGAAYILWLAVHIAISTANTGEGNGSASFLKGFMPQFVNVKIYLFGITALTGYITPFSTSLSTLLLFEFIIATLGTVATCTWVAVGMLIQRVYLSHSRAINIVLGLTLLECVYSMLN